MCSRSSALVQVAVVVSLLASVGCGKPAEQAATAENEASVKPEPEPPKPEVDTAAPPEPEPPPVEPEPAAIEPDPTPPEPTGPSAGEGFELGAKPKAHRGDSWAELAEPLEYMGATVSVTPDDIVPVDDEGDYGLNLQVRVEFDGADPKLGLNHLRPVSTNYCDHLISDVQEVAKLGDGRWLVDAQLACRMGEDYFSAENARTLIVVDPVAQTAAVLWTGTDSGENAMGVCVSSSVSSFEVRGEQVIIRRTEFTDLDKVAGKHLKAAAEGCVAKPETTEVVERIDLARGK